MNTADLNQCRECRWFKDTGVGAYGMTCTHRAAWDPASNAFSQTHEMRLGFHPRTYAPDWSRNNDKQGPCGIDGILFEPMPPPGLLARLDKHVGVLFTIGIWTLVLIGFLLLVTG